MRSGGGGMPAAAPHAAASPPPAWTLHIPLLPRVCATNLKLCPPQQFGVHFHGGWVHESATCLASFATHVTLVVHNGPCGCSN